MPCHLFVRHANEKAVEIRFLELEGAVVASLNGLILREFQPEESPEALFLRPVWKERAAPIPDAGLLRGRLLLFDPDTALMRDIQLRHPALSVTRVVPGDRFAEESGLIQINPQAEADYERLIETGTPDYILYRWVSSPFIAERYRLGSKSGTRNFIRTAHSKPHLSSVSSRSSADAKIGAAKSPIRSPSAVLSSSGRACLSGYWRLRKNAGAGTAKTSIAGVADE